MYKVVIGYLMAVTIERNVTPHLNGCQVSVRVC